jgi:hypothetical protein
MGSSSGLRASVSTSIAVGIIIVIGWLTVEVFDNCGETNSLENKKVQINI